MVELIPPLSFIIVRRAALWASHINTTSQAVWFTLLLGSSFQLRAIVPRRYISLLALLIGIFVVNLRTQPYHPLDTSNNIAECLLALTFSYLSHLHMVTSDMRSIESIFGVLEILPVAAFMLGCNTLDAGFCYIFIFMHRCYDIFVTIADQRKSLVCQTFIYITYTVEAHIHFADYDIYTRFSHVGAVLSPTCSNPGNHLRCPVASVRDRCGRELQSTISLRAVSP